MSLSLLPEPPGTVIDPVCGMKVRPERAAGSHTFEGKTYHFCSRHCLEKFKADPKQFLKKGPDLAAMSAPAPATPPGSKVEYICPMDPGVLSDHPGACPICGMALEPRTVSLDEAPSADEIDLKRRFWIGLVLGVPLLVLAMGGMIPGAPLEHSPFVRGILQALLATPIVLWSGWPLLVRAWDSLRHRSPNMFTLVGLG